MSVQGASVEETDALKRGTLWPKQDFVIIPLEPETIAPVLSALGGTVPKQILHVQIEKSGAIQFAAYDQFQPGSIVFGSGVSEDFLASLVAQDVMRSVRQ